MAKFDLESLLIVLTLLATSGCTSIPIDENNQGELSGRVLVQWDRQDSFIYRVQDNQLSFRPSFMQTAIVPGEMYTDGGSVPQIFWNIPGLAPWGLGPAYIIHDWLFLVHRCGFEAPDEVKDITFQEAAQILAEVGAALARAGLVDDDRLPEIYWAVRTRYARSLWDRPAAEDDCLSPPKTLVGGETVVDLVIPPTR